MSGRSSFVLYMTSKRVVDKLSDEQAGVLFKKIFAYVNGDDLPEMHPFVDLAFTMFQEYLDADYKKYQEKVERRIAIAFHGKNSIGMAGTMLKPIFVNAKQIVSAVAEQGSGF